MFVDQLESGDGYRLRQFNLAHFVTRVIPDFNSVVDVAVENAHMRRVDYIVVQQRMIDGLMQHKALGIVTSADEARLNINFHYYH